MHIIRLFGLLFLVSTIFQSCSKIEHKQLLYTIDLDSLMNIQNARPFTCTGLAYNSVLHEWYVGNIGISKPEAGQINSSIEVFNEDFTQWLRSIELAQIFPNMVDVQGLSIDSTDGSLWVCSYAEDLLRKIDVRPHQQHNMSTQSITQEEYLLDSLHITRPTGVTHSDEYCWILTPDSLLQINRAKKSIRTIAVAEKAQDQIAIHNDEIFITYGNDYSNNQFLLQIDTRQENRRRKFELEGSYAVEGIVIRDSLIYVANDGFYHSAKNPKNIICVYKL